MPIYIQDDAVLVDGDNVAVSEDCCCEITCCTDGFPSIQPLSISYQFSVSGTADDGCEIVTLVSSSVTSTFDLGSHACILGAFDITLGPDVLWEFNSVPGGTFDPNCSAQPFVIINCSTGEWTIEGVVSSSASSGNCAGLCGGGIILNWGGADVVDSVGSDPRGVYHFDVPDIIFPTLIWSFDITIS